MRIQVLYFAYFRERLAKEKEWIDIENDSDVADALKHLGDSHDCIATMQGKFRVALNQEFVDVGAKLRDGDEIALIPPVAGGVGQERHVRVISTQLSVDRVVDAVSSSGMGGIVTFIGQVRDFNDGHDVIRLEYEAYGDMAVNVMTTLCETIESEIPGSRLAVEHRTGTLGIGDAAVVIAAAAPHRAEAFKACQALIDRLKKDAPIWKKEVAPDGEEWLGIGP